jgi:lysophospholipase L1-like esterase
MLIVLLIFAMATSTASAAILRLACVGDSITAGTFLGDPSKESYPARLKQLLGTNYVVTNFGVSGTTALKQGDFPYWNDPAFQKSHDFAPNIVTILFGANDSKPQNWAHGTNFESDYAALIASYTNLPTHPRILLLTPCPVYETGIYDINPGIVATNILPIVWHLSESLGVELVNINTPLSGHRDWFYDQVHPNTRGFTVMAACLRTALSGGYPTGEMPSPHLTRVGQSKSIITWPAEWGGLVLQFTPVLRTNTTWFVDSDPSVSDGLSIHLTNATTASVRFYRFWKP